MKYQLYLGLNDKDTKLQKIDTVEAYKMVENILLNNEITGYTIYQARGVFKHENGAITQENTLIIEMIFVEEELVDDIIQTLKTIFNQESIMKTKQDMMITFEQGGGIMETLSFKEEIDKCLQLLYKLEDITEYNEKSISNCIDFLQNLELTSVYNEETTFE